MSTVEHKVFDKLKLLYPLIKEFQGGTALVVQWLRIHLPMHETRVRSLVWEDPTGLEAAKPTCATAAEPAR